MSELDLHFRNQMRECRGKAGLGVKRPGRRRCWQADSSDDGQQTEAGSLGDTWEVGTIELVMDRKGGNKEEPQFLARGHQLRERCHLNPQLRLHLMPVLIPGGLARRVTQA